MDKSRFCCLVFGEILYDCFADRTCLGGAALNFAWILRQLGFPVAMISAVGRDALGRQARDFLREADIAQQWVADRDEPTGTVNIFLRNGQPSYTILSGVAWDFIETQPRLDRAPDLLYYGTAAQRSAANRPGLEHLLAAQPRHRFFDINLRKDAYTPETVLLGLEAATIVKLNDEEWEEVRHITGIDAPAVFIERFGLDCLAITCGAEGARLHYADASFEKRLDPVPVVDAVGAGDAFSGVLAAGALLGTGREQVLDLACTAGSAAVQHPGAHLELPAEVKGAFA